MALPDREERLDDSRPGLVHPALAAVADSTLNRLDRATAHSRVPGPIGVRDQRASLERILQLGGPSEVLLAASRFDRMDQTPLFMVLLNSDDIDVLLAKMTRLDRYFHSRHRHQVVASTSTAVELRHVSTRGADPEPVESLFAAGLYLALFEGIGCCGLRLAFPDSERPGWVYEGAAASHVPITGTSHWRFRWDDFEPTRLPPEIDELVLADPGSSLEQTSVSAQVAGLIERDLARPWRVREVARELWLSPRTLQRRLRDEGTTLTNIVADLRMARARELLADPANSVTDVGYMLGFADSPHFTRVFSAAMGRPPSEWRGEVGAPG